MREGSEEGSAVANRARHVWRFTDFRVDTVLVLFPHTNTRTHIHTHTHTHLVVLRLPPIPRVGGIVAVAWAQERVALLLVGALAELMHAEREHEHTHDGVGDTSRVGVEVERMRRK